MAKEGEAYYPEFIWDQFSPSENDALQAEAEAEAKAKAKAETEMQKDLQTLILPPPRLLPCFNFDCEEEHDNFLRSLHHQHHSRRKQDASKLLDTPRPAKSRRVELFSPLATQKQSSARLSAAEACVMSLRHEIRRCEDAKDRLLERLKV